MIITITPQTMRVTGTCHSARCTREGWRVSWLPGCLLTWDRAVTAMKIAGAAGCPGGGRAWQWAGELGLPAGYTIRCLNILRGTAGIPELAS